MSFARSTMIVVVAFATTARADREEAARHHDAAVKLVARGEYRAAVGEFEAAYRAAPQPIFLFNIAQAYRMLVPSGSAADGRKAIEVIAACGRALAELVAILLGIGFIIGALSVTGLAGTLANDLVFLAGAQPLVLLVMGAITSFIFGMGMTVTACYVFLAIVLAPPLVKAGLDPLAVHLFIMYWGMVSFITPPVALGAFAAASLARCGPFAVGWEAVRLGSVVYFLPFFFVLNPALILKGSWPDVVVAIGEAAVGIVLIAAALQGWLVGIGDLGRGVTAWCRRALLLVAGLAIATPTSQMIGRPDWQGVAVGLILAAVVVAWMRADGKRRA